MAANSPLLSPEENERHNASHRVVRLCSEPGTRKRENEDLDRSPTCDRQRQLAEQLFIRFVATIVHSCRGDDEHIRRPFRHDGEH